MAKAQRRLADGRRVPLRMTEAQHRGLQATARGEVYLTHSSIQYTLAGPGGSQPLWVLLRVKLIADPSKSKRYGRHQMVLTAKGCAALSHHATL